MGTRLDQTLAVLNGLVGDYLQARGNGLATEMAFYRAGEPLALTREAILGAHPEPFPRVLVLVHGLMCDERIFRFDDGSDYGTRLQAALGFTPFYLRYNTGLSVAENGVQLSRLLEALVAAYPVPVQELILVGYSMGGLLIRAACHRAATDGPSAWLPLLKRAFYVGTPHAGAPAERLGRVVGALLQRIPDPYTRLVGDVVNLRSAGIKDLGDARLRAEDSAQARSNLLQDPRHPVPLLPGIQHGLIAGDLWVDAPIAGLFGDAVVPVDSASGKTLLDLDALPIPKERVRVFPGRNHVDLAHDAEVADVLREWCDDG